MRLSSLTSFFREYDWVLPGVIFLLTIIGLSGIYSIDLSRGGALTYFPKQVMAACIGLGVFFVAGHIHTTVYRSTAKLWYLGAIVLLVSVLFFGQTVRGTTGWFRIAGLSFQPVELAKVALILFLGFLITRHGRQFDRPQFVLGTGLSTLLMVGLILLQPDLGSAVIVSGIWFGMLCLTRTKKWYIAAIVFSGVFVFLIGWFFVFAPYQKDRILTFLHPAADASDAGYNLEQSIIAIGSGRWFGRGLGFGSQSQLHFLPEAQTDFIFAAIAEELGFVGVGVVLFLYTVLLIRLLLIALRSTDDFGAYVTSGIALFFFIELLINIGGVLRLLPLTGVTLPFLSYGGSSLIINFFLVGIAESISRNSQQARYA